MAESPLERLKRIAAEKRAAEFKPVAAPVTQPTTAESETESESKSIEETKVAILSMKLAKVDEEVKKEITHASGPHQTNSYTPAQATVSTHPLAMEFAELEAALLATDPEFKTKLRQIHRHLGNEPELVTQMTEEEIRLVVSGMIVFANAEIVAPAAAKTAKAKIKAAAKQVISADDL